MSKKKKVLICEHRALPVEQPAVYARGLCRRCYDKARWSSMPETSAMIKSAVDLPLAKALKQVPKAKRVPFRVGNPKVANLIANAAIKNALDLPAAVAELKPDFTPSQVANVAEELERSPQVQAAIQQGLQKRGLDGQSRERFVEILWKYAEDADAANEKRTLAAWRILGRGFIGDKIEQTVIEPLRIEGWEEGVRRMLADAPDPDDSNSQSLGERNAGLG